MSTTMMASLKLNIADFVSKLGTATGKLSKFRDSANKIGEVLHNSGGRMSTWAKDTGDNYKEATKALNKHNLGLRDTARIVQGIMVSQTFYTIANSIGSATAALWDFNKELDYAKITYSALFGSTDLADKFSTALQEHAVETIFDYQQLSNVSKKLLAYGIEYKNLMFVMEGLTNLGAMSGDPQAMDRIGLALGQIKTTGYLTAAEMRQLSNAYVPIYDIVQEAFGLTGEQMESVGDLKIPAHKVINAIVDYANDKFGEVGDAATMTITGLENRIVDTLKVVGSAMLAPLTTAYKSFLTYVSGGLAELRNAYDTGGLGGVFEFLVPDENMQATIRQFIANVKNLLMSLASVLTVVSKLFGNFAQVVVTAFNIIAPVIANVVNVLSAMLNAMLQNSTVAATLRVALVAAAGAFVLLRVQAIGALVITAVTKAVNGLSGALVLLSSVISKHPIASLLVALGVALVGISAASGEANKSISGLFDTVAAGAGASSKDILQPVEQGFKDSANAADEFNKRLEEGAGAADDLAGAIGGAGNAKKALGLLSFDEVFKLPEESDSSAGVGGAGNGLIGALGDLTDTLGGLSDSLIPEIPDFSDYIDGFTDSLFGGLSDALVEKLQSVGIGALIGGTLGAIIGGILGGPAGVALGAKIGAFAGGVAGLIYEELEGALANAAVGAGAGIVNAISKALTTAGAASITTIIKNAFAQGGFKGLWTALGGALKTTGLKSMLKGGVVGAAIGLLVDGIAHLLWTWMADSIESANVETAKVGQTIGSVLGAIIGALIGGPAGAMIGSAIGTFAIGLVGLFWDPIAEYFDPEHNALSAFYVRNAVMLYEWATKTATIFVNWVTDTWNRLSSWWTRTTTGFSEWWDKTFGGLSEWLTNTIAIFTDYDNITGDTLRNWWTSTKEGFKTWLTETAKDFGAWVAETLLGFSKWDADTKEVLTRWGLDTLVAIVEWAQYSYGSIIEWVKDVKESIGEWKDSVVKKFEDFKADASKVFDGFKLAIKLSIKQWLNETVTSVASGLSNVKEKWVTKWNEIKAAADIWWSGLKNSVTAWLEDRVWKPIANFFNVDSFWKRISGMLNNIKKKINSWWTGLFDSDVKITANLGATNAGHATGGVFNREHIARFAEGNKAEAIIPLENNRAMQPFVDAVSNGLVSSLAPIVASVNSGSSNNLPPLYVGTLIADERGIKQLYDKFEVIRLQEADRRGLATV